MVKETDIKQSLTYSTLKRFNHVYGAIIVFPIALLLGNIGSDKPAIIVFKDFMNEEHRMMTHHLFMVYELPDYMEKDLIIYYSKDYPKVLIGSIVKDETQEEDSNGINL